jgi:hypothetical protein
MWSMLKISFFINIFFSSSNSCKKNSTWQNICHSFLFFFSFTMQNQRKTSEEKKKKGTDQVLLLSHFKSFSLSHHLLFIRIDAYTRLWKRTMNFYILSFLYLFYSVFKIYIWNQCIQHKSSILSPLCHHHFHF